MNVSRVGMTQPSFKGWISDGRTAINDAAVAIIKSASPDSYASMHLVNGIKINTRLSAEELIDALNDSRKNGFSEVEEHSFIA